MTLTALLPFVSAAVMLVFVVLVFRRYLVKGGRAGHLLLWGIGLLMYFIGSLTEALHTAMGWSGLVFRLWYLFGAMLVAAWLGQGTAELLIRSRIGGVRLSRLLLAILLVASLYGAYRVFSARLAPIMIADEVVAVRPADGFDEADIVSAAAGALQGTALRDGAISDRSLTPLAKSLLAEAAALGAEVPVPVDVQPGILPAISASVGNRAVSVTSYGPTSLMVTIEGDPAGEIDLAVGRELYGHAIVSPGVRSLTPFFNLYGVILLVGGAIYSAWIFLRKRIMPNRVIGNVLIAAGSMMPAVGGLLSRFGLSGFLYISELLGAILIFVGFIAATTRPELAPERSPAIAPASGAR